MSSGRSRGFTLIELMVVMAVIGILVALLLPAVQQARGTARLTQCRNNAKQINLALQNYHDTYNVYPPGSTSDVEQGGWIGDPTSRHIHSWSAMILPYLESSALYHSIDFNVSSMHPNNRPAASHVVRSYRCPSYSGPEFSQASIYTRFAPNYATTNYVALGSTDVGHIYGQNTGIFAPDGTIYSLSNSRARDVTDGLSNTILIVETREENMSVWIDGGVATVVALRFDESNGPSYAGIEVALNYSPYFEYSEPRAEFGPSSMHTGGAIHCIGDGSVRFISDDIAASVYTSLTTRAGGEVISGEGF